jgi:CHAT domain-containing protein
MRAASISAAIETDLKRATLLGRIAKVRFLHIATHGWFDPDKPDQSGLLMVDADNTAYRVTIRDISNIAFSGLELAVLSGCWSADNFVAAPKTVIGLPQTLLAAGAHSVVGSLWRIHDALAPSFMERFYQEACGGRALDVAMQRAQIACLRRELGDRSHRFHDPRYWAPFLIYGDARPLRLGS